MAGEYQSTREFTHDTEWILHNCIIYNGCKYTVCHTILICIICCTAAMCNIICVCTMAVHVTVKMSCRRFFLFTAKHALTKIAKGIVKVCKEDVRSKYYSN